jgi:hypothetical protein
MTQSTRIPGPGVNARMRHLRTGHQNMVVMPTKRSQDGGQKVDIGLRFIKKCRVSSSKRNNRG